MREAHVKRETAAELKSLASTPSTVADREWMLQRAESLLAEAIELEARAFGYRLV